ncbi:UNKNOWN [Stylonychia lemnae]|uniref:O-acyltransferase WSD1 C-terminal domain-containing protein n=1 Tax=Stylonychia lemnae TaxID=5949 RepID=A0A078AWW9_STYLE|nr:UNKNOWN [Stylonychia lemnae]|eukprot:CDW86664.1 UNKNOWN [Stylonychia lemnae]
MSQLHLFFAIRLTIFYYLWSFMESFVYGLLIYIFYDMIFDKIMSFYGLKRVPCGPDLLFNKIDCYILMYAYTDQIKSIDSIKEQFKKNGNHLGHFRSKYVELFGSLYLRELKGAELKSQWKQAFIEVQEDIKDEKQLGQYITKIGSEKIENCSIQFRIYFIKNFMKDQSCIIIKTGHGLADGVGILLAACGLQDSFDHKQLPVLKPYSFVDSFMKHLMAFFFLYYAFIPPKNVVDPVKIDPPCWEAVDKAPSQSISKDFKVSNVLQLAKKFNCTVNDLMMAVINLTMRDYFAKKGQNYEKIKFAVAMNCKRRPDKVEDFYYLNYAHSELIFSDMKQEYDFQTVVNQGRDHMSLLKNSYKELIVIYIQKVVSYFMPSFVLNNLIPAMINLSPKISISNLNGPTAPLQFGGAKTRAMSFTCTFGGSYCFFSIFSHLEVMKLGLYVSRMNIEGDELMEMMEKKIEELMLQKMIK